MIDLYKILFHNSQSSFTEEQTIIIYISMFAISVFLAFIYDKLKFIVKPREGVIYNVFRMINYFVIIYPVASIIGMRDIRVGFDTRSYIEHYLRMGADNNLFESLGLTSEPGFSVLHRVAYFIWGDSWYGATYPMVCLTLIFLLYALDLWDKKNVVPIGLYIFYMGFGLNLGDQSRQLLAISITAVGFYYLYQNNIKKFVYFVVFATFFHYSSIVAFFLIPFSKIDMKKKMVKYVVIIMVISVGFMMITSPQLLNVVLPSKYRYILLEMQEAQLGSKWIADVVPYLILMLLTNYYSNKSPEKKNANISLENLVWFALAFRIAGYSSFFIMRLYYIPAIMSIQISLCNLSYFESRRKRKLVCVIIMLIFGYYFYLDGILYNTHNMIPYSVGS